MSKKALYQKKKLYQEAQNYLIKLKKITSQKTLSRI